MKRLRGRGSVYRRGALYWIQYYVRGKRFGESSGSTSEAVAVRLLKRRISEVQAGKPLVRRSIKPRWQSLPRYY